MNNQNQNSFINTTTVIPFSKAQKKNANDRQIRFRCFLQNTILDVLKSRGWQEVQEYIIFVQIQSININILS